jgi:hypothetical protein
MVRSEKRYSLDSVKQDVKSFFQDDNHWAYQYGSKATSCGKDSVFYKKQIQVIFENRYPHDITGKAVNELIVEDKFLKDEPRTFGKNKNVPIIFVCRRNLRYISNEIKRKIKIIDKFSDDELNEGVGKYAEILFNHMFTKNQFKIISRHTNTFRGKTWRKSSRDLDFIIEKDGISYGGEIKNTFDYMPQDEFEEKLDMCQFLRLLPVFPLRYPSPQQYALMQESGGLALTFKTRIFPPGNQTLVTDIWNHFRLPVSIWDEIPPTIENLFLNYHYHNLNQ